jgi:hypothetical protein
MRVDTLAVTSHVRVTGPHVVAHRVHNDLTEKTECVSVTRKIRETEQKTDLAVALRDLRGEAQ